MKSKLTLTASAFLLVLVSLSVISAFGVSAPYWEGNPLQMARGDVVTVNLNLQNMIGDEDVQVKATLKRGSDITSLKQDTFTVKAQTADTMVPLKIKVPKDIEPGKITTVQVDFQTSNEKGGVSLGTGMVVSFDVVATQEVKEADNVRIISVSIAIVVLLLILWFLLRKKKKK